MTGVALGDFRDYLHSYNRGVWSLLSTQFGDWPAQRTATVRTYDKNIAFHSMF